MCVDIWKRPPCGHNIYQNTFRCEHIGNGGHSGGAGVGAAGLLAAVQSCSSSVYDSENGGGSGSSSVYDEGSCCSTFEDELYHRKPSAAELRRRRLSSLSSYLAGPPSSTSPSATGRVGSSVGSQCRMIKAIRPVQERECPECALEFEGTRRRQQQWYQPRRSATTSNSLRDSGGGSSGLASPITSTDGIPRMWDATRASVQRRVKGPSPQASATRRLEDAFAMIARQQRV
ncbi:hypothetical protein Micbo1qcDRAFT_168189 [Microdochium bolleyi]|uniref:Uncharacterized protein n=1 Tax=Microdochium bolleyi TaxID=196109 RepID=A0A136IP73_9PEZI|nr:hypothetical protein Micbo1qcDRAFT_168189 [Microdochium bolleyi]